MICLGCRERRIKCELPSDVEIPDPGELRTVQTPCYRCKKLGVPCIVRQTILGRPSTHSSLTTAGSQPLENSNIVSRIAIELPLRTVTRQEPAPVEDQGQTVNSSVNTRANHRSSSQEQHIECNGYTLLVHTPQSTETLIIIRAVDTLRSERVENEWFRHLPACVGHSQALDLSIKALVTACAYSRGVPRLSSEDCYHALALALNMVQKEMQHSHGALNDELLASTALLAPFEGVIKKHGIPMRPHVEGLGAILGGRPATYPVTQLAQDILDFHVCDSAIMACIQGTPSPFESVAGKYYAAGCSNKDRAQIKSLGSELFIRIPRLVGLIRSLRLNPSPENQLLEQAIRLWQSLLTLQDSQAEERLLQNAKVKCTNQADAAPPLRQSMQYASVDDFEALAYYWANRLLLCRLEYRLHDLFVLVSLQAEAYELGDHFWPSARSRTAEMLRLVKNILMSAEYARTLPLHKHQRLFVHAIVNVWGVTMDIPGALRYIDDGEGAEALCELLLRRVSIALGAKPHLNASDMDTAADVFVGGQPKGRFVDLFYH